MINMQINCETALELQIRHEVTKLNTLAQGSMTERGSSAFGARNSRNSPGRNPIIPDTQESAVIFCFEINIRTDGFADLAMETVDAKTY